MTRPTVPWIPGFDPDVDELPGDLVLLLKAIEHALERPRKRCPASRGRRS
jgi:hypothetical protein